ncbi:TPA: hypothetical protein RY299_002076 [Enterobacter cloacae]|nr:hypothetical protein [Enterobacter cloacae]HEB0921447.1 hypothetical protein [Enterobacter cloacae]HEB0926219.1 hypothetical protein [Enterobacter cloacae]HEB0936455.1 hypothetical protein [Enterobacter cloacae]HEB0941429.1 hypothetical protein [Enterobacter cloacae]
MDNRYEIAEQNGMSREFADWFFDNKKAGCGNVWFMMMAAMWEGWQGRTAMLQGAEPVTTAYKLPEGWVAVPVEPTAEMVKKMRYYVGGYDRNIKDGYEAMLAAAPQQE